MAKILVVDDEEPIRMLLSKILRKENHEVMECDNGLSACEAFNQGEIDLIITDLVMPEQNGIEMIMQLRKSHPMLKVIAISGGSGFSGQIDLLSVAKLLGAKHIIRKPFSVDDIRNAVNDTLATAPS
jgi:two-component system response regulator (stage 0 sporulation protein F)